MWLFFSSILLDISVINISSNYAVITLWWILKEQIAYFIYLVSFKEFIYLREREIVTEIERESTSEEEKGEAGSSLSREPDVGLDPRTLRSWPETKADASPTEPPGGPLQEH